MSKGQSNLSKWMPTGMLVAGILLSAATAWAQTTETVNGVRWTYVVDNGEAHLYGEYNGNEEGDWYEPAISPATSGAITIPPMLGGNPVTGIGYYAFYDCGNLTQVTIPDGVRYIWDQAFYQCTGLTNIVIPNSVTNIGFEAFAACSSLTDVTLPDSVTSIDCGAFNWCSSLSRLDVPSSWAGTDMLAEAGVPDECEVVYRGGNAGGEVVVEGVTWRYEVSNGVAIVTGVDAGDVGSVTVPSELGEVPVTGIGAGAFAGCAGVTNLVVPDCVMNIGENAFMACESLEEVWLPTCFADSLWGLGLNHHLLEWGGSALQDCAGHPYGVFFHEEGSDFGWRYVVTNGEACLLGVSEAGISLEIPATLGGWPVTSIGENAFGSCDSLPLTELVIPDGVTRIGSYAFASCSSLTVLHIPDSVASIGENAFMGCDNLQQVWLPAGLAGEAESYGFSEWMWYGGSGGGGDPNAYGVFFREPGYEVGWKYVVTNGEATVLGVSEMGELLEIPTTLGGYPVTGIGDYAFGGCDGLRWVFVPEGVTWIGMDSFAYCTMLEWMEIPDSVTSIGEDAFTGCENLHQVWLPAGLAGEAERYGFSEWLWYGGSGSGGDPYYTYGVFFREPGYEVGWKYVVTDGVATVLGVSDTGEHLEIPATLGGYPVTGIGDYSFSYCPGLLSVSVPDGVTWIGNYAFEGCSSLTNLVLGESVESFGEYAFAYCSSLETMPIPAALQWWGQEAFYECTGLVAFAVSANNENFTSPGGFLCWGQNQWGSGDQELMMCPPGLVDAVIPEGVTAIGWEAFKNCPRLETVTLPDSVWSVSDFAFNWCGSLTNVDLGHGVQSIGGQAFYGCTNLTSLTIPASVSYIGGGVFSGCSRLGEILVESGNEYYRIINGLLCTLDGGILVSCPPAFMEADIPSTVTNIADHAFDTCERLASVDIPDSVRRIGQAAFFGCSQMTNASIGSGVTNIGSQAFYRCSSLESVVIPDNVKAIGNYAFDYCSELRTLTLGNGLTNIPSDAFHYCSNLTAVAIPNGVKNIDAYSFDGCHGLQTLVLGSGVTNISVCAFRGCYALESVSIPDSVKRIGDSAFSMCYSLAEIEVPGSWRGTDKLNQAGLPASCKVTYRGVADLTVTTDALAAGKEGVAYEASLAASGGTVPYRWSAVDGAYAETAAPWSYAETGTAQGWQADNACWDLPLPFAFPYFGQTYTSAKVNSNGALSFGSGTFSSSSYSSNLFYNTPIIAVLWRDMKTTNGNIYVERETDAVTVEWRGVDYYSWYDLPEMNFSVTLRADGTIEMKYGEWNRYGGTIGISAGDGKTAVFSAKSGKQGMANAPDIVFRPVDALPPGMELTTGGVLRGTPEEAGTFRVGVAVTDATGETAVKVLPLVVSPAVAVTKYPVVIASGISGGMVSADKAEAEAGETVALTVEAWDGMKLVPGSLKVNGVAIEGTTFSMPAESVIVTAEFAECVAVVTIGGTSQTWDGRPKGVTVATEPAGLAVRVTYRGSTNRPSAAGTYAVVATVLDAFWEGSATGTLAIVPADIGGASIAGIEETYLDGDFAIAPVLTFNGKTLAEGVDYTAVVLGGRAGGVTNYADRASVSHGGSVEGFGEVENCSNEDQNSGRYAGWFTGETLSLSGVTGFADNTSYLLYANGYYEPHAEIRRAILHGETLTEISVDIGINYDSGSYSGEKGVKFLDAQGRLVFGVRQGDSQTILFDRAGFASGRWSEDYGTEVFTVTLTRTTNGYVASGTTRTGGTVGGIAVGTTADIAYFAAYMDGATPYPPERDYCQLYFDNLRYTTMADGSENMVAEDYASVPGVYTAVFMGRGNFTGTATRLFEVLERARPDLVPAWTSCPNPLEAGAVATFTWTVANQGGAMAEGSWTEELWLTNAERSVRLATVRANGPIATGGSAQRVATVAVPLDPGFSGDIRVVVKANADGGLDEISTGRDNNEASAETTLVGVLSVDWAGVGAQTYTGAPIEPMPTVLWNGASSTAGVWEYAHNVHVGTASAAVTLNGKTSVGTFPIAAADIAAAAVGGIEATNTAGLFSLRPELTFNGMTLAEGIDYTFAVVGGRVAVVSNTYAVLAIVSGTNSVEGFGETANLSNQNENAYRYAGYFTGPEAYNVGITGFTGNTSFGLYANGYDNPHAEILRAILHGESLTEISVDLGVDLPSGNAGCFRGIEFLDARSNVVFGVRQGNSDVLEYYGADVAGGTWSERHGKATFTVTLTRTAGGYVAKGTTRTGGSVGGIMVPRSADIAFFRAYMEGAGTTSYDFEERQLYFDNLRYTTTGTEILAGIRNDYETEPGVYTAVFTGKGDFTGTTTAEFEVLEGPRPDLTAEWTQWPSALTPGETTEFSWTVSNGGTAAATGSWTEEVWLTNATGSVRVGVTNATGTIEQGGAATRTAEWTVPEYPGLMGEVQLVVRVNVDEGVREASLGLDNNEAVAGPAELAAVLTMELATAEAKENAGSVRCVVRRSGPTETALTVEMASSRTGDASVPATMTIPAGARSGSFCVTLVDNGMVDGTRTVTLAVSAEGYEGAEAALRILDDEVPSLGLIAGWERMAEGETKTVVVTRELVGEEALTVNLSGIGGGRVTCPGTVTIPAGEMGAEFEVSVANDETAQGESVLTLRASAAGYTVARWSFAVDDDDVPGVVLTLSPDMVGEGAGGNAVRATLTRTDTTKQFDQDIKVRLTASPAGQLIVPSEVTIPARTVSRAFNITPIDNGVVDGEPREVVIDGAIVIPGCGCTGQPSSGDVIRATMTVTDDDVPALSLRAEPATMKEGLAEAGWLVLGHNSALDEYLTVALSFDTGGEISIPETATIPAGETEVRVQVATLDDGVEDGAQLVSVYAEDPARVFAPASTWVQVSDQNLPDLAVAEVVADAAAVALEPFAVRFTATNAGFAACARAVPYAVHVTRSRDASLSSNTVAATGMLTVGGGLAVGGTLEAELTLPAPEMPGDAWVAVVLDPERTVTELDDANNTGWSGAVGVSAAWTATVTADAETYLPGGTITLSGTATLAGGSAAAGVDVDVYLLMNGMRRTLKATTGADGTFATSYVPTAGEAGHYAVGACYPGAGSSAVQDEFDVLGVKRASSGNVIWDIAEGDTATRTVTLRNQSAAALTGLTAAFAGMPEGCELSWELPETLPGNGSIVFRITATATAVTEGTSFTARVESAEGVSLEFPLHFRAKPQSAALRASPGSIDATMAVGQERYIDVTVTNEGQGDSGPVSVAVPNVRWLRIAAGARAENLAPGESMTVTLLTCPTEEDGLAPNQPLPNGRMNVTCTNGPECNVALTFTPVTERTGAVLVRVTDNNVDAEGNPGLAPLEGALVRIVNNYVGVTVASGTTGADGTWGAEGLAEGTYQLYVAAAGHESCEKPVEVEPDRTTEVSAFLKYEIVSATWDVVRTEIEDGADIQLMLEFETHVPAPNVVITFPKELPDLAPGESHTFTVLLENTGLIAAEDVTVTLPEIPGYEFRMAENGIDIPAKSAKEIPVVLSRLKNPETTSAGVKMKLTPPKGNGTAGAVCIIEYENTGTADLPAPVFEVSAEGAVFEVGGILFTNRVRVLGLSAEAPVGTLRKGEKQELDIAVREFAPGVDWSLTVRHAGQTGAGEEIRAGQFFNPAWVWRQKKTEEGAAKVEALRDALGRTWGEFAERLGAFASVTRGENPKTTAYGKVVAEFVKSVYWEVCAPEPGGNGELVDEEGWVDGEIEDDEPDEAGAAARKPVSRTSAATVLNSGEYPTVEYTPTATDKLENHPELFKKDNSLDGDVWCWNGSGWTLLFSDQEDVRINGKTLRRPGLVSVTNGPSSDTSVFNPGRKSVMICHGMRNSVHHSWVWEMARALKEREGDVNILAVDWAEKASKTTTIYIPLVLPFFIMKTVVVPHVSAAGIDDAAVLAYHRLRDSGVQGRTLTLIGHSHGGHLAGRLAGLKFHGVQRLIGLDVSTSDLGVQGLDGASYWLSGIAEQKLFYKSSWNMSLASVSWLGSEMDADFNFALFREGDFYEEPFYKDWESNRHAYVLEWFTATIRDKDFNWGYSFTDTTADHPQWSEQTLLGWVPERNEFAGVINTKHQKLECATKPAGTVNADWKFRELIFNIQKPFNIDDLHENTLRVVDYTADSLLAPMVAGSSGGTPEMALWTGGRKGNQVQLTYRNRADNTSIPWWDLGKLDTIFLNIGVEDNTKYLPWETWFGQGDAIANSLWLARASDIEGGAEVLAALENGTPLTDGQWIAILDKMQKIAWHKGTEDNFARPGGGDRTDIFSNVAVPPNLFGTERLLGRDEEGRPLDGGEECVLVGLAGENNKAGVVYTYDLAVQSNNYCMAVVKVYDGGLGIPVIKKMGARETGDKDWITDETVDVWATEDGVWSVELDGSKSIFPEGSQPQYWWYDWNENEHSRDATATFAGTLEEGEDYDEKTVWLAVSDSEDAMRARCTLRIIRNLPGGLVCPDDAGILGGKQCWGQVRLRWWWTCGPERPDAGYSIYFKHGTCESGTPLSEAVSDNWTSGSGTGGGGGVWWGGGWGSSGTGSFSGSGGGFTVKENDCNKLTPCQEALVSCGQDILLGFVPGGDYYSAVKGGYECGESFAAASNGGNAFDKLDAGVNCTLTVAGAIPGLGWITTGLSCLWNITKECGFHYSEGQAVGSAARAAAKAAGADEFGPGLAEAFGAFFGEMQAVRDWVTEFFGSEAWAELDGAVLRQFLADVQGAAGADHRLALADVLAFAPPGIGDADVARFVERWNATAAALEAGESGEESEGAAGTTDIIRFGKLAECAAAIREAEATAEAAGGESAYDLLDGELREAIREIAERQEAVCASVELKLSQSVVFAREAFLGTLTLYNGHESAPMGNIRFDVKVTDAEGNPCNGLFGITNNGVAGMTGTGVLEGGASLAAKGEGTAEVLFVPTPEAAGETAKLYKFGGTLTYDDPFSGARKRIEMTPVGLMVNPTPELHLDYFVQRDVYGDDPFTTNAVEASLPAELAVLVRNTGWGDVKGMRISSVQPEVVRNEKGEQIDFRLSDYSLDEMALNGATAHLGLNDVSLGTVPAKGTAVAQWWLTASIQGHFTGMSKRVLPMNDFGNPDTSLIRDENVRVHKLIRSVESDGDGLPDFLTSEEGGLYGLADTLITSAGVTIDVAPGGLAVAGTLSGAEVELSAVLSATQAGWTYGWAAVPGAERYEVARVTRGDGSEVPLRNVWITDRVFQDGADPVWETRLRLVDECVQGDQAYTVELSAKPSDGPEVEVFEGVEDSAVVGASPGAVTVVFSTDVDGATFGTDDLTLRWQGALVDDLSGLRISGGGTLWTIGGLGNVCGADGRYELTVQCAGIANLSGVLGTSGRSVSWTVSGTARPAVQGFEGAVAAGTPVQAAGAVTVVFTVPVAGFDAMALRLDGAPVPGATVEAADGTGTRWLVSGLDAVAGTDGEHVLTVVGASVTGLTGLTAAADASVSWTRDTLGPEVLGVTREEGLSGGTFRVALSEAATVQGMAATLARDGLAVTWPEKAVWTADGAMLVLSGLGSATAEDGEYELMVAGSGLRDAAGNAGTGSASVAWTVDTVPPAQVQGVRIDPDLGESDCDGVTSQAAVTVRGTLAADAASVTVVARYASGHEVVLAGPFAPEGTVLACAVTLPGAGNMSLVVRCADAAGNASETAMAVYLDAIAPTAEWETTGTPVESALLRFSAGVMPEDVGAERVTLTRDGVAVSLAGATFEAMEEGRTYRLSGEVFAAACDQSGAFELRFDGTGVRKASSGAVMANGAAAVADWSYTVPPIGVPEVRGTEWDEDSFAVEWTAVSGAEGYRVTVREAGSWGAGETDAECLLETEFEGVAGDGTAVLEDGFEAGWTCENARAGNGVVLVAGGSATVGGLVVPEADDGVSVRVVTRLGGGGAATPVFVELEAEGGTYIQSIMNAGGVHARVFEGVRGPVVIRWRSAEAGSAFELEGVRVEVVGEEEGDVLAGYDELAMEATRLEIDGLDEGTEYAVRVMAVRGRHEGPWSEGARVRTRSTQTLDFGAIGQQVATNRVMLGATATSGLAVSYDVDGPAELDGTALTFTGAGTVAVTASQPGNVYWEAADSIVRMFQVTKAAASVTLGGLEQTFDGTEKLASVTTEPAGLSVAVTYAGGSAAPVNAGSYAVIATVEDAIWEGRAEGTLVIGKASQAIDFATIGDQVATDTVVLSATASSGLPVSYAVSGPAVLRGTTLTFTGAGTVTVTAQQSGNANWKAAEDVERAFLVTKAAATVTVAGLEWTYDGTAKAASVTTEPAGLSVAVTYAGGTAAPVNAGSYAVVATVDDPIWEGRAEGTLVIAKATQTITFAAIGNQVATNTVKLSATASSGLSVSYTVTGPAVRSGTKLTFTGAGTVKVTAKQAGNANWAAAKSVARSFNVTKAMAAVTLSELEWTYDGESKAATVTTAPEGLALTVTYDGSAEPPVAAGSYAVVATVEDPIWAGSAEGTLAIAKATQTIDFAALGNQIATNTVKLSATASSGLPVSYLVSGPAELSGTTLTFSGAGTVNVIASQVGDDNWEAAEDVERAFLVTKAAATVAFAGLEWTYDGTAKTASVTTEPTGLSVAVTYAGGTAAPVNAGSYAVVATVDDPIWAGSAEGTLVIAKATQTITFATIGNQVATNTVKLSATASSGLPVSYTVTGPAVLSGTKLTFTGAGTVKVTAKQAGNANWAAAKSVARSFNVTKAMAAVTLSELEWTYDGESKAATVTTAPEGLAVTVTYDGSAEPPVAAGSYAVVATVEDAIWAGSAEGTLAIAKATQTIDFAALGNQIATNTVTLSATASSGLPVSYVVSGPAELSGTTLTFTGEGTVKVIAKQAGNANWVAAESVERQFLVEKATGTVTLSGLEWTYDGEAKVASVTTEPAGLSVVVTYDGSTAAPVVPGSYAVVATVDDPLWSGRCEGALLIAKKPQRIDFAEIGAQEATAEVSLEATAESGEEVVFEVVSGPGQVAGNVLTFTGGGTVKVKASQAGNEIWEAAEVTQDVRVRKASQGIDFVAIGDCYATETVVLEATAASGQDVEFALAGDGPGVLDGNVLTFTGEGTVMVVAIQLGDELWNWSVAGQTIHVSKTPQSIEFAPIVSQSVDGTLRLEAMASSGLPVGYEAEGPAVVEEDVVSFTGEGIVTVTARQAGNALWAAATDVVQTFRVRSTEEAASAAGYERWLLGRNLDPLSEDLSFDSAEEHDSDGDGMTNWKEYLADTDPTDSADFFAIHARVVPVQGSGACRVALWSGNISSNRIYRWVRYDSLVPAVIPIFVGEAVNGSDELLFEADVEKTGFWRLEVRLPDE